MDVPNPQSPLPSSTDAPQVAHGKGAPGEGEHSVIAQAETWVVKVGSRVLSASNGRLDESQVESLARQLSQLTERGKQVVLVSSGAVASGIGKLALSERPTDLAKLQAVAAVGQAHLIQTYERHFAACGRHAAQILLIADDLDDRVRYLNVRNTLLALLDLQVIPIINENDTVAVDELLTTFGDNDRLAGMVAGLFSKPALVILSDVAGLYDRDPSLPDAKLQSVVQQIDPTVLAQAAKHNSRLSKGGMASKLKVAQFVTQSGAPVVIAGGRIDNVLPRLLDGEPLGTLFMPQVRNMPPRKRWIGFSAHTAGAVIVDAGAMRAICEKGSSLLSIGITEVHGAFTKGDVVSVLFRDSQSGDSPREIARGLCNYASHELSKILGLRSADIAEVLGHRPYEEVIHRDNITPLGP